MPTYKHPCPHCGTFIARDVAACPACGRPDPFAPARCAACKAIVEPGWVACPKCGTKLESTAPAGSPSRPAPGPAGPPAAPPATTPAAASRCSGCGAALPTGARFCRECGTVAG